MAKIKADFHNHFSTLENIGDNIFDKSIRVAQKNLGIAGIFGVINAQDKGIGRYETFLEQGGNNVKDFGNAFGVPNYGIYVIKGQEVFTQGGHILVLGLNKNVRLKDYRTLEDSLKEAKDNNGIIIADHPFFLDGIFTKQNDKYEIVNKLDAMEIHNGESWLPVPGYVNANKTAQDFYNGLWENCHLGAISTSDGHSIKEIGTSYSILEQPDFSTPENLVKSLRKSIREHKDFSQDKKTNSIKGTLNHSAKVVGLRIASKLGMIGRIN